jgi:hypothetical protein
VAPIINPFWETASFPHQLIEKLGEQGWGGCNQQGNGCSGLSLMCEGLLMVGDATAASHKPSLGRRLCPGTLTRGVRGVQMEMARVDASVSLFFLVHDSLCMATIGTPHTSMQKLRIRFGTARQKLSLNDGQIPTPNVVRVASGTGYHRVEGNRQASRNGPVRDLPPGIPNAQRFAPFASLDTLMDWLVRCTPRGETG